MLWLHVPLFASGAEVLVSSAKANTSIFHHRGPDVNLSHTSCFRLISTFHLELPHLSLVCIAVLHV